ncbi:hypothetical protein L2D50_23700 [Serratia marcescens]|nr:hypothetical protein [Serratia marcescens]UMK57400.1 hypothetical protein L2D50_23700 [Serratia marcescens]
MNTGTLLRALANGVNPDTGELLKPASAACAPEAIRLLFALANEFDGEAELQKKARLTPRRSGRKIAPRVGRPMPTSPGWKKKNCGCARAMRPGRRWKR